MSRVQSWNKCSGRIALQIGYSATPANLATIPVYVLGSIVTCGVGYYADRKRQRGLANMYVSLFSLHARRPVDQNFPVFVWV